MRCEEILAGKEKPVSLLLGMNKEEFVQVASGNHLMTRMKSSFRKKPVPGQQSKNGKSLGLC